MHTGLVKPQASIGPREGQGLMELKDDAIEALFAIVQRLTESDSQIRLKAFRIACDSIGTPSVPNAPEVMTAQDSPKTPSPSSNPKAPKPEQNQDLGNRETA